MSKPVARGAARKVTARRRAVKVKAKVKLTPQVAAAAAAGVAAMATSDRFLLQLDASCTLRETADLQFSLVAANGDPLVVDGGAVERIDTSGLQLLVALAHRQRQAGRRLEWKAASPELLKCSERLGLSDALGLASAADGEAS